MKRLPLPTFGAKDAVERCAAGITIAERSQALLEALPTILSAEASYKTLAPAGQLFQLPTSDSVTLQLSGELMGTIYKSHFVRVGSPSRSLYEAIRFSPPYGICPMCGQRIVASVDHYLPQSLYPAFDLTPVNLVPACSDCNKGKLAKYAQSEEEQTLHPYFDELGNERWLVVDILQSAPPSIAFRVRPPAGWTPVLVKRVERHFQVMGLGELYTAQAASELADISHSLVELGSKVGAAGVRSHLFGEFASRNARDPNSWKTALYEGLCASDWFCNEGYRDGAIEAACRTLSPPSRPTNAPTSAASSTRPDRAVFTSSERPTDALALAMPKQLLYGGRPVHPGRIFDEHP